MRRGFKAVEVVDTSCGLYVLTFCPSFPLGTASLAFILGFPSRLDLSGLDVAHEFDEI